MADTTFWTDYFTALVAAWSPTKNIRVSQYNRINWATIVEAGTLVPPFAITQIGLKRESTVQPMDSACYIYPVTSWYVAAITASTNIHSFVEEKLNSWNATLIQGNAALSYQVIDHPDMNVSDDNEANMVFYKGNIPLFAGQITAQIQIGNTIY